MNTYTLLKTQKKKLELIIKQKPIDDEQRKAVEQAKLHLNEINKYLKMFGDK